MSTALSAHPGGSRLDFQTETFVAHTLRGEGFDASEDGTGRGTPLVPVGITLHGTDGTQSVASVTNLSSSLRARIPSGVENSTTTAVLQPVHRDLAPTLTSNYGKQPDSSDTSQGPMLVPVTQPYTLAIRGRGDSHNLEYRQDGTANALLTPNGGRGGIGVGAIAHAFDARQSDVIQYGDKTGPLDTDGHSVGVLAFSSKDHGADATADLAPTLRAMNHADSHANGGGQMAVAFHENQRAEVTVNDTAGSLKVGGGKPGQGYPALLTAMQVRRLTPRECERLQGFPDDYTAIPWRGKPASECPDGPRYKALGNSWAVPVVRWIGRRIVSEIAA